MIRKSKLNEKIAVAYFRMSTDKQDTSIIDQREAVYAYAEKKGYTIIREYLDEGISGDDTKRRTGFKKLHADAQEPGDFSYIICWAQDRFGRFDSMEAMYWLHPLRERGIKLVTLDAGEFDFDDSTTMLVFTVNQMGKNQFLKDLSRNVTRGMLARAKQGRWMGGKVPYGFKAVRVGVGKEAYTALEIADDETPDTIRSMYRSYLKSEGSLCAVARELNAAGIKTPKGAVWASSSVRQTLESPLNCGRIVWNRRHAGKYNGVQGQALVKSFRHKTANEVRNDQSEWIEAGECPAIVDRKLWDRVNDLIAKNRTGKVRRRASDFALAGQVVCGCCGSKMDGMQESSAKPGDSKAYRCRNGNLDRRAGPNGCKAFKIRESKLLPVVVRKLTDFINTPDRLDRLVARIREKASAKPTGPNPIDAKRRKLAEIDATIAASSRRLLMVPDSLVAELAAQVEAMKHERNGLDREIRALDQQAPPADSAEVAEAAIAEIKNLGTLLTKGGERAAEAVRRCVETVTLWYEETQVQPKWRKPGAKARTFFRPVRGEIQFRSVGSDLSSSTPFRALEKVRIPLTAADFAGVTAA